MRSSRSAVSPPASAYHTSSITPSRHAPAHVVALTYVGAAVGFVSHHTDVPKLSAPWWAIAALTELPLAETSAVG
jgi:hypothetical protein